MRLHLFCQFHYFGSSVIRSTVRMAFYLSPGLLFCDEPRKSRFPGWLSEMQQWLLVSWTTGATSDACLQTRSSSVTAKPRVLGWSPKPEGPEPTAAWMVAALAAGLWFHDLVWAPKPVLVAPTCFNPESWTSLAADLGVCGAARSPGAGPTGSCPLSPGQDGPWPLSPRSAKAAPRLEPWGAAAPEQPGPGQRVGTASPVCLWQTEDHSSLLLCMPVA